jgi:hypothetical protein
VERAVFSRLPAERLLLLLLPPRMVKTFVYTPGSNIKLRYPTLALICRQEKLNIAYHDQVEIEFVIRERTRIATGCPNTTGILANNYQAEKRKRNKRIGRERGFEPATRWVPKIAGNTPGTTCHHSSRCRHQKGGLTYLPLDH